VLSYHDEGWLTLAQLRELASVRGHVEVLAFPSRRYVGAQIGVHDPQGRRVGRPGRLHNVEYVLVCGEAADVRAAVGPAKRAAAATGP